MAYQINPYELIQDVGDDLIISITDLLLSTDYAIKDYVLTLPLISSKSSVILYFINGSFDTNIPQLQGDSRTNILSYKDLQGNDRKIDVSDAIQIPLTKGNQLRTLSLE